MATSQSLLHVADRHRKSFAPIEPPDRLLLGPGPSNAHPTVLQALARTPIGHLDPLYVELMGEVQELLRYAWQTDNRLTLPMSGTGSAAMEATIANTVEPGDTVLVAVKGYFGLRLVDMAGRYRANVKTIEKPWGEWFSLEELEAEGVRWAREVMQHSPTAIRCLKAAFNAETDGLAGLQELAGNATHLFYRTDEAMEGRDAFLEKRPPDFGQTGWLP